MNRSLREPEPIADIGSAAVAFVSNLISNVNQLVDGVSEDSRAVARELQALYASFEGLARDAARATPRFARIVRDVLHVVASYRVHRSLSESAAGELIGPEMKRAMLERVHRESAERLYALCIDLRGGVLKLGQFVSTRRDLLPDAYVESLSRLQDRVPPVPTAAITARIEDELAQPLATLFSSFEHRCLAAASLAQVHAAQLSDGTPVAVKVQVPGIEDVIETDIAALQIVTPMIRDLVAMADLETIMRELVRALRSELDYQEEARAAAEFAACFAQDERIIVPGVHSHLSSSRVITLEYIEGERLTDYLDACETRGEQGARDRDRIFEIMISGFCAQVLVHGLFHADPHPGNFLVVPSVDGPRLAILDFGNVQRFAPDRRRAYAEIGIAILTGQSEKIAELLGRLGFHSRSGDPAALVTFADLLLEAFREGADPFDIDPKARLEQVLELTRSNPIVRIPADFVQLGRVFAALGGLLMRYRPRLDLFRILMPCLVQASSAPL